MNNGKNPTSKKSGIPGEMVAKNGHKISETALFRKDSSTSSDELSNDKLIECAGKTSSSNITRDITEHEKAEEALQESEERFRSVVQSAQDGIILIDSTGKITFWNKCAEAIFSYTEEEVIGKPLTIIMPERYRGVHENVLGKSVSVGKTVELEGLRKDGSEVPIEVSLASWESKSKIFYSGIIRDITERKQAEDALKASEKKYSTLVEKGDDGIIIVQDGIVKFANRKMAELVGRNKEDILGSSIFEYIPKEYKETALDKFEIQLKSRKKIPLKYEMEILSRYGLNVPVEVNASMIEHSGEPAVMEIIRDITDRKMIEEKLKKYAEDLSKANEKLKSLDMMKDEFLSNVGHELKTPLVSIIGYNELMYDETLGPLTKQQKKAMEVVVRNSEKLRRLIDSLLYLSLEKSGKIKFTFSSIQIIEIVEKAIVEMVPQVKEKCLNIESDLPEDLPLIEGDEHYLKQILTNLIDNAIKFTPSGGLITVVTYTDDNNLHIEVKDTGIGIAKELIPDLFKLFYQLDGSTTRRYEGTGLGMYICKSIVEKHNGEIWVESEEGVGTTVHVTLPS